VKTGVAEQSPDKTNKILEQVKPKAPTTPESANPTSPRPSLQEGISTVNVIQQVQEEPQGQKKQQTVPQPTISSHEKPPSPLSPKPVISNPISHHHSLPVLPPVNLLYNAQPYNANPLTGGNNHNLQFGECHRTFPLISEDIRSDVIQTTTNRTLEYYGFKSTDNFKDSFRDNLSDLQIRNTISNHVVLFTQLGHKHNPQSERLLNPFDILVTEKITMDFDWRWQPYTHSNNEFSIFHPAMINIGESAQAQDFANYSKNGKLQEDLYIKDSGHIIHNTFRAQVFSGITDSVLVPVGMAAFFRHLNRNDHSYKDSQKVWELKKQLAAKFLEQIESFPDLKIHLCLPMKNKPNPQDMETNQNFNAFIQALCNSNDKIKKQVTVYINVDACHLSQTLANGGKRTGFINAANPNLIPGNQCLISPTTAKHAIDENATRRSTLLPCIGIALSGIKKKIREFNELRDRIHKYKGRIFVFSKEKNSEPSLYSPDNILHT
jgi:uncharacterized protein YlzI (FlbEa/FlbD family)